jgi:hypothetical protein
VKALDVLLKGLSLPEWVSIIGLISTSILGCLSYAIQRSSKKIQENSLNFLRSTKRDDIELSSVTFRHKTEETEGPTTWGISYGEGKFIRIVMMHDGVINCFPLNEEQKNTYIPSTSVLSWQVK